MEEHDDKIVLSYEQYPGNSKSLKDSTVKRAETREKRKQVVSGRRVKKPLLKRISDAFVGDGAVKDVGDYIMYDVVVPAAKAAIADLIEGSIEMLLYGGERRNRNIVRNRGQSFVRDYNEISTARRGRGPSSSRRHGALEPTTRVFGDFSHIVLNTRADAETVMGGLAELLGDYEVVSVADLYDLVGLSAESQYTDNKYGWDALPDMRAVRVRDGWIIELPSPKPL